MSRVVMITSPIATKEQYLGLIGEIEKVNSYSGIDRYYIPGICEDLYFFEDEFTRVDLRELSGFLLSQIGGLGDAEQEDVYDRILLRKEI